MSRGKSKKKKTTEAKPVAVKPSTSSGNLVADQQPDDSETEFEAVEETLKQSLSYDTLTWMKHVIKVQSENVLKNKLAQISAEHQSSSSARLESEVLTLQRQLAELKAEHKESMARFTKELEMRDKCIMKLEAQIDSMDQQNRLNNVRVVGLEETDGETTKEDVVRMMKLEKFKINSGDIEKVHRLGKRNKTKTPRDTLVKFKSQTARNRIYDNRIAIAKTTSEDRTRRPFINEDLTKFRAKLLYDTRCLVKEKTLTATWSQYGNIMIMVGAEDKPIALCTHQDLMDSLPILETTTQKQTDENRTTHKSQLTDNRGSKNL